MSLENRDRLLRLAWELPQLEEKVSLISEIAQAIGPARTPSSEGPAVPYTLLNLAEAARRVARASGGGATTLPGRVILRQAPHALRLLAQRLPRRSVLISGTNGKTTTASMLAAILREAGHRVSHNQAGANIPAGVATALLEPAGDFGVFEVDEAWLPLVAAELSPTLIVLGNLFRDRLDGYGELEALAIAWEAMMAGGTGARLVLNADDAALAGLGATGNGDHRSQASFFGVEDRSLGLAEREHTADSIRCRSCAEPLRFQVRMLSHLGHHRCDSCGVERPHPAVRAERIRLDGISGSRFSIECGSNRLELRLQLPGLYNVYNALAAAAAALALGIEPAAISRALRAFAPVFGRGERIRVGATDLLVLLMKNPAGANELMRTLGRGGPMSMDLLVALNDGLADGRDVSWIWDADFELLQGRVGRVICAGRRAAELALRLKYAGWPVSQMAVESEIPAALDRGIAEASGRLIVLPTYSALLEIQIELANRGLVAPFWSKASQLTLGTGDIGLQESVREAQPSLT